MEIRPIKKPKSDDFKKSFGLSLGLHAAILGLFMVKFVFFDKPIIDLSQAINVSVGEMTDTNKLPSKIQPETAPEEENSPEPEEKVAEEKPQKAKPEKMKEVAKSPKEEALNLSKSKAKQKEALDKLKKLSALDKIKQDLKKDSINKIKNQERKSASSTPAKPRIIAAGSALSGLDKLQANTYLQQIDKNIKEFWTLPQWLMNKPLKAQALVKFNIQGQIISSMIISSSGNSSYDQYCLQAISKAAPFPSVPDKLSEKFSVDGVVIGFPE